MKRKKINNQENANNFSMEVEPIFDEYILNENTTNNETTIPDSETDEIVESMNSFEDWLFSNEEGE